MRRIWHAVKDWLSRLRPGSLFKPGKQSRQKPKPVSVSPATKLGSVSSAARPLNEEERKIAEKRYIDSRTIEPDVKQGDEICLWNREGTSLKKAVIKRISIESPVPNSKKRTITFVFESEGKEHPYQKEVKLERSSEMVPLGIYFKEEKGQTKQFLIVKTPKTTADYEINPPLPISKRMHYY